MLCHELGCIGRIIPRFGPKVLPSIDCKKDLGYNSSPNCATSLLQNNIITKYRQFSTSQDVLNFSLPDGLLEYAQHKIENPDQQLTNFSVMKSLENALKDLKSSLQDKQELQEMLNDPDGADPDMIKMATSDIEMIDSQMVDLVKQIKELVVPKEKYDNEDAIIEVVPGAGGLEANLFAEEIFNMYLAYVAYLGYTVGKVEQTMSSIGKQSSFSSTSGITHASAEVSGINVFGQLKFESGVHRVQRVPITGNKSDRLQTSTCSVAILPKARDLEMSLPAKELKYEFMRSSGAGGQGVNTTDSACRLTHLPTGLFVKCQEERSQQTNKKKALEKLQNMLYQREFDEMMGKVTSSRKLQVGNMNRNEKIRTYNFSRHMLSEHRIKINKTFPSIVGFLSGNYGFEVLEEMHNGLAEYDKEQALLEIIQNFKNSSNSSSE